jgi:hypothetical protein
MLPPVREKLVVVHWVDSAGSSKWQDFAAIDNEVSLCVSVGWLLHSSKAAVTLIPTIAFEDKTHEIRSGLGALTIPRPAIKRFKVLSFLTR